MEMVRQGIPYHVIGDKFGISKQRCSQIIQEYQEPVSDDSYRELQRTKLEFIQDELFKIFTEKTIQVNARGPVYMRKLVSTADGLKEVNDLDQPVEDKRLRVEVAGQLVKLDERLSKLTGTDRLKARSVDQDREMQEFLGELERTYGENEALRKRVEMLSRGVIEAEVIPSS